MRRLINDKKNEEENLLSKTKYYENQTSKKNCQQIVFILIEYYRINSFSPFPRCFLEILAKIPKHFSSNASFYGRRRNTCKKYMFCTGEGLCPFPVEDTRRTFIS